MKKDKFTPFTKQSQKFIHILKQNFPDVHKVNITIFSQNNFNTQIASIKNYRQKYFTGEEITYCKNNMSRFAGRFALKTSLINIAETVIPWTDIQILPSTARQPIPTFLHKYSYLNDKNIAISLTHEENLITAISAIVKSNSRLSLGIDAVKIGRFTQIIKDKPEILQKIFTPAELDEIKESAYISAEKWAGKEAVSKALGIGIWHGGALQDIEILKKSKKSKINLTGKLSHLSVQKGYNDWLLQYMQNDQYIIAIIVAT